MVDFVMDWPKNLDVIIEYDEEKSEEKSSTLLQSMDHYGPFGPMAQYQTTDGEKFWIVSELLVESREKKTLPKIPVEVITKQASIDRKLAFGQQQLNKEQKQQETGLILPDAIKV